MRRARTGWELSAILYQTLPRNLTKGDIIFACIGTDRSTGDSFGPLVGTALQDKGYRVVGTIDDPLHAMNLAERLENELTNTGKVIVAVDASLGKFENVGSLTFRDVPMKPGAGVKKDLPLVGEYSLEGIVNVGGFMEYFVLQNTRLSVVMRMVKHTVEAIDSVILPLEVKEGATV